MVDIVFEIIFGRRISTKSKKTFEEKRMLFYIHIPITSMLLEGEMPACLACLACLPECAHCQVDGVADNGTKQRISLASLGFH